MADDNTTPFRADLPPTLHGAVIKGEGNGPTQARNVMNLMYSTQGQVTDLKALTESKGPKAPGQAMTPARVPAGQAAQASMPVVERAIKQADTTIANLGTQIDALDKQITSALMQGKADPASMAEIRSYWLAKGSGKENTFIKIGERFQNPAANLRTVSAILDAPGYLSGIDDASNMAALRDVAARALVGDLVEDLAQHRAALKLLTKASARFTKDTATLLGGMTDRSADLITQTLR